MGLSDVVDEFVLEGWRRRQKGARRARTDHKYPQHLPMCVVVHFYCRANNPSTSPSDQVHSYEPHHLPRETRKRNMRCKFTLRLWA